MEKIQRWGSDSGKMWPVINGPFVLSAEYLSLQEIAKEMASVIVDYWLQVNDLYWKCYWCKNTGRNPAEREHEADCLVMKAERFLEEVGDK